MEQKSSMHGLDSCDNVVSMVEIVRETDPVDSSDYGEVLAYYLVVEMVI